jgi:hypothetical protein
LGGDLSPDAVSGLSSSGIDLDTQVATQHGGGRNLAVQAGGSSAKKRTTKRSTKRSAKKRSAKRSTKRSGGTAFSDLPKGVQDALLRGPRPNW